MANTFQKRYIWYRAALSTAAQTTRLLGVMKRGAAVGWNGIVVNDPGLKTATQTAAFLANLNIIKAEALKLNLALIPVSISTGEAKSTLLDIREGLPVRETKFVVSSGKATCKGDPIVSIVNGGFESNSGNAATGWIMDKAGTVSFVDKVIKHSGTSSIRVQNPKGQGNIRLYQAFPTTPFRSYKISVWIKTEGFSYPANIRFLVIGASNGRYLYSNRDTGLGSAAPATTSDWTQFTIDVNPLENTSIRLYLNSTGSSVGKVWFDDVSVTEAGLYSTIRRSSLPIVVKSYDKTKTYLEGKDYIVGTEQLSIPVGSTIPNGAALKVSWFSLCDNYERWTIPGSASQPEFYNVLRTNAENINSKLSPKGWMMNYDEIRVCGWDPSGKSPAGVYLAEMVKKSEDLLKVINPNLERYIWNDEFDPYHNAGPIHTGENGSKHGSWAGLSPEIIAVNWYNAGTTNNLKFWAGLDPVYPKIHHRQIIAGYYESVSNVATWLSLLTKAESEGVTGVDGFLYTTWSAGNDGGVGRYDDLEAVAALIKASGRWGTGPAFPVTPIPPTEKTINDDNPLIKYIGAWTNSDAAPNRINGDEHHTNTTGASVELTFTGTQVKWLATKFSNRGHAEVFLDGTFQATIDQYNSTVLYQQEVFAKTGLPDAPHVLKIVCKGTKNASSTGAFIDVDAFKYK